MQPWIRNTGILLCGLGVWVTTALTPAAMAWEAPMAEQAVNQGLQFNSAEGRFSVALPPTFPAFEKSVDTSDDPPLVEFMSLSGSGLCAIFYSDFGPDVTNVLKPEELLNATQDGVIGDTKKTMVNKQQNYRLQGHPARSVWFQDKDQGLTWYTRTDLIWVSPRLYQVYYRTTNPQELEDPKVTGFFNSFQLK